MRRWFARFLTGTVAVPADTDTGALLVMDSGVRFPLSACVPKPGLLYITLPASVPPGNGGYLTIYALGTDTTFRVVTPLDGNDTLPDVVLPAQPLVVEGRYFKRGGRRYYWRGSSDFTMLYDLMAGRDVSPVLRQRQAAGATGLRVFLMLHYIQHLDPAEWPGIWTTLVPFARFVAGYGMDVEFTCLADCQVLLPRHEDQQAFITRVGETVGAEPNVICEAVNEYPKNGVDAPRLSRPPGRIWSRGSSLADASPAMPAWDYSGFHPRRDWPKVAIADADAWFVGNGVDENGNPTGHAHPCIIDEPIGFAEAEEPGRRSNDPELARILGHTSLSHGQGGTFHSGAGLTSQFWGPITEVCAHAYFGVRP